MRLSTQTEAEKKSFEGEITLSSGSTFNHRKTLKKINLHKRLEFTSCSDEDAIFWALGLQRAPHFAKKLDLDTKYFQVEGYGDYNATQAWATNIRFRKWARDTRFALDLDDFSDALADFGSCALKLVERKEGGYDMEEMDLMKLWFDPTIKSFKGQTKIELHELSEHELSDKKGWDNTNKVSWKKKADKAWKKAEDADDIETEKRDTTKQANPKKKFWERIGYFNVSYYEKGDIVKGKYISSPEKNEWKFMHTIHTGIGNDEVIVSAEEIKEENDLYRDLHISKYEDRWLRIGIYERLFDLQRVTNESVNYDREAQQISSLIILKTKNKKLVGSSILQEAKSGLITDADLEQMGITNTAYGEFLNKLMMYEQKADSLCLTPDVLTGESTGAKTFRGQAALTNQASSAFKKPRDRVAFVLSDILVKRILPQEMKGWNKEKTLEIAGFDVDLQIYDTLAIITKLNEYVGNELIKGNNPTAEDKQTFVIKLREKIERDGRKLKLPKNYYDFEFGLTIPIQGETTNLEQRNDVYWNVIQMIMANPAVNQIPAFREYVEKNGITPFHLNADVVQQLQQGQQGGQQGGGQGQPVKQQDKLMSLVDSE